MSRARLFAELSGVAGIGILLLLLGWQNDRPAVPARSKYPDLSKSLALNRPLLIKEFTYTTVDKYGMDTILEADELEVKPRRFMAFNLKFVNEAIVGNARLMVYTHEGKKPDRLFSRFESAMPLIGNNGNNSGRSRGLGLVTRLVFETITMELFRDEQKIIILEAATGLTEKKKEGIKFFNATLRDARSNHFVKARKILWNRKRKVFIIPGQYIGKGPSGSVTGKSVEIDMDFIIS